MRTALWDTVILVMLTLVPSGAARAADPFPGELPGTEIGSGLPNGYEPSGAVWHTGIERLFVVGDGGQVTVMDGDGAAPTTWNVAGDLEGICVADPVSPFVYVGVEHPDGIIEFNWVSGTITRTFDLTGTMQSGSSNQGLEALTFVPGPSAEGGLFYAGLQEDGQVYVFSLPIQSSSTSTVVTHVTTFAPVSGRDDLSGLHYHDANDVLYAIFDSDDALVAMETDGTFLVEWVLAGRSQEGVTIGGCDLFVAEDGSSREVWRYGGFPADPGCVSGCRCADLTENGVTNLEDFATFAACFDTLPVGGCVCSDLTGDGVINLSDFATFAGLFGQAWNEQAPPNCVLFR